MPHREACAAYIASQKHEGWAALPEHYDDGGISGGTPERAALGKLLLHVDEGLVDPIASTENLSNRRIRQVIALAFLAPDIVKSITQGQQPGLD
jgi:hypothetical protein